MKFFYSVCRISFLLIMLFNVSCSGQNPNTKRLNPVGLPNQNNLAQIKSDSFPLLKSAIQLELKNNTYLSNVDTMFISGGYNLNRIVFGIQGNKIVIIKNALINYSKLKDANYAWEFILASEQLFIAKNNKQEKSLSVLNTYKYLNGLIAVLSMVNNSDDKYLLKIAVDDIKNKYYQFNMSPETMATLNAVTNHQVFQDCLNVLSQYVDLENSDRVTLNKEIPFKLLSNVYAQASTDGIITSYFSNKTPFYTGDDNYVFLHVNRNINGRITLNFVIRYNDREPLYFNSVNISIDGEKVKLPSSANFFRDNNSSHVTYKMLLSDGGDIDLEDNLNKLIGSETAFVELYSNEKLVTIKISKREKKAIKEMIDFYKQLKSL